MAWTEAARAASALVRRQRGKKITPIGDKKFAGLKLKATGKSLTKRVPFGINRAGKTVYTRVPIKPNLKYKNRKSNQQKPFVPSGRFYNVVGRHGWKKRIKNTIKLGG